MKRLPVIFYRIDSTQIGSTFFPDTEEYDAANSFFDVYTARCTIPHDSLVIPRYSALPFYRELEVDMAAIGCKLINNYVQHRYVADIGNYYPDIQDCTPKTWVNDWVGAPEGAYVVKGRTNSRKMRWNTMMFAKNKAAVPEVVKRLLSDTYIAEQGLVVREYRPLRSFDVGINDVPITNEWRFFILNGSVLLGGYYWSIEPLCCPTSPMDPPQGARDLAFTIAKRLGDKIPFFVVDVAETAEGKWIVIELNDGQMSGLSMIEPLEFYKQLRARF